MSAPLTIVVYGLPAPQGSKRYVGKGVMVESSRHVKPWREAVRSTALTVVGCNCPDPYCGALQPGYPFTVALTVEMVFTFARPRSHYRAGRNAHLLRDGAPNRPGGKPDLSKLARSTEDALTDAGVWHDDSLVVEYSRLAKVYADTDPDALSVPGVLIRVRPARPAGPVADIRTYAEEIHVA